MGDKMYTVATAASELNLSKIYIRKAIERKQLKAQLVGSIYIIFEDDLNAWNSTRKRSGRPKLGT